MRNAHCSAAVVRTHEKRTCREFAQVSENRKYGSHRRDDGVIPLQRKDKLKEDHMSAAYVQPVKKSGSQTFARAYVRKIPYSQNNLALDKKPETVLYGLLILSYCSWGR